uniref:Transmembrane BAX inhibitor motif containing 1a n=1 Tax=Eptatretus burgeri TaxID=7764 RepID=A0A8C4QYM1_EPTBU
MPDIAAEGWSDKSVRQNFIKKVYTIVFVQLAFTTIVVAICTFVDEVGNFVRAHPVVYYVSYGVFIALYLVMACVPKARKKFPCNFILLVLFTLALSYMTGMIASFHNSQAVLLSVGITALVVAAITLFCFQTKVDITSWGGYLFAFCMALFIGGIIASLSGAYGKIPWLHTLFAALGVILFTMFLMYNTQLLLGNRQHAYSAEDYIGGALSIYTSIIQIFQNVVSLID